MEPLEGRNLLELLHYLLVGALGVCHSTPLPTAVPSSTLDSLPYVAFGYGILLQQQRNK